MELDPRHTEVAEQARQRVMALIEGGLHIVRPPVEEEPTDDSN